MNTTDIYINNLEYINKSFKRKNRAYGTYFEKEMVNIWLCGGELMTNKFKKNSSKCSNMTIRLNIGEMDFIYKDGYLISNFLLELGCNNYKFECMSQ